ncbi:hypothetical protein V8F33_004483 [Rhypophila sp. PSN 637]
MHHHMMAWQYAYTATSIAWLGMWMLFMTYLTASKKRWPAGRICNILHENHHESRKEFQTYGRKRNTPTELIFVE